jgi:DNA-binding XRE family transcriptional regulator
MTAMNDPFYEAVGKHIHGFRVTRGLTQGELGLRLGPPVTRASIANLENGRQRLLLHTAVQIAQILGCDLRDLLPACASASEPRVQSDMAQELKKHKVPKHAQTRISRQFMVPARKDRQ